MGFGMSKYPSLDLDGNVKLLNSIPKIWEKKRKFKTHSKYNYHSSNNHAIDICPENFRSKEGIDMCHEKTQHLSRKETKEDNLVMPSKVKTKLL